MITALCQRWTHRHASYRPAGEPIATREFDVAPIPDDRTAKAFVVAHHYSGSYPAARFRLGLYRHDALVGVAVFSQPCNDLALRPLPGSRSSHVELGRFVLHDNVPANGETWFLGRCFESLRREGVSGVVSFSDPVPRRTSSGSVVFRGHVGTIYQAHNACYVGRARAGHVRLLPDGSVLHNRALAKVRRRDRGWRYVAATMTRHGAAEPPSDSDLGAWLDEWLPRLTRTVRHAGNHKYAWAIDRRLRKHLPASLPYPKFSSEVA